MKRLDAWQLIGWNPRAAGCTALGTRQTWPVYRKWLWNPYRMFWWDAILRPRLWWPLAVWYPVRNWWLRGPNNGIIRIDGLHHNPIRRRLQRWGLMKRGKPWPGWQKTL